MMEESDISLNENTLTDALDSRSLEDVDIQALWKDVMTALRDDLSGPAYSNYLQQVFPLRVDSDHLTLSVPSDFVRDWLVRRLSGRIQTAVEEATGKHLSLLFEIHADAPLPFQTPKTTDNPSSQTTKAEVLPKPIPKRKPTDISESVGLGDFSISPLNNKYTFENFIVGRSNYISHAASLAVAKAPAKGQYNPLFIYGGVGLGKTHLMQAIGHYINAQRNSPLQIVYVSGENFLYQVVRCIREDRMTAFRRMYRSVDVWLVDDIQYICNAERTEVEFFHIFNALYDQGKQIVICSDKPPKELNLTESRLTSRFEWGLITYIDSPDLEHRIAILQRRAEEEGVQVDLDVLQYLAERIRSNIRSLEGALTRLVAMSSLDGRKINLDLAAETVRYYSATTEDPIKAGTSTIIDIVAAHFGISTSDILGKRRSRDIVAPRQIAMFLARDMGQMSYPDIGREFSRDYTTAIHSFEKIKAESEKEATLRQTISDLRSEIRLRLMPHQEKNE